MRKKYSQIRAMLAITKASLRAQFRSPIALVFGFMFPLFFILIFGSSRGRGPSIRVAIAESSDTLNPVFTALHQVPIIVVVKKSAKETMEDLGKGRITAILNIQQSPTDSLKKYIVTIQSSKAGVDRLPLLQSILKTAIATVDDFAFPDRQSIAQINTLSPLPGRVYRSIDFILPGQLGFSLLSAGLFGVAFLFFNLRDTLVLKRLNASPIHRPYIIFGETLARIIFQMIIVTVILLLGVYAFSFTLVHGWVTFVELLILSFIGLLVFMGFGFFISGFAKNINTIPVLTNILGFPQFMLSGTFFPIENLPSWLHPVCRALPLTHLNDAMRNVAFEGSHLNDCGKQLAILGIWGVVMYAVSVKVFKWE